MPTPHAKADVRRQTTQDLYGALGQLGERLYLEALCLCDDEKEAAAFASASLIRSLEERGLLGRLVPVG